VNAALIMQKSVVILRNLCFAVMIGQVQILWLQDLPVPFPVRERFTYCKAEGRRRFSSQGFNNGSLMCISIASSAAQSFVHIFAKY